MEATTIYKTLNDIFEELYHLFDKTISNPEYTNNSYESENCIAAFTHNLTIVCEWDLTDEEREGSGVLYFEAGRNDVDAVYYPFDLTKTEIDLDNINRTLKIWKNTLECIKYYSTDNKFIEKANDIEQRIRNLQM
jgi:hypothetical protein